MSATTTKLRPEDLAAPAMVVGLRNRALIVGLAGVALSVVGFFMDAQQFYQSYLVGYLLWLGIALGCLALGLLVHVTAGAWGVVGRRILEAGHRTLPVMLILFIPILFGLEHLYSWARPEVVAHDELIQHKAIYLNKTAFIVRTVVYFALWSVASWLINRWSLQQDRHPDPQLTRRLRLVSAPGVAMYFLLATFASIDWLMSLEPHWFSSIYGIWFAGGHGLSALAWVIIVARVLTDHPPLAGRFSKKHFSDYGNLMFAFIALWAYFSLSQFLIIWSGNLPEETFWYLQRLGQGWQRIAVGLIIFHFALPFLVLLSRFVKQNKHILSVIAILVLVMRWIDLYWNSAPTFSDELKLHWLDPVTAIAVGGLWIALFFNELRKRPLLPVGEPNLEEALSHD